MPLYDFRPPNVPPTSISPQVPNLPDVNNQPSIAEDSLNKINNVDIKQVLVPGFSTIDRSILNYFDNIIVPLRDTTKKLEVRLSGGDKTILIWKQDLDSGRIKLPVMSINRSSVSWNAAKYSPAYVPVYRRFADQEGTRMAMTFREYPCLIEYQLSIWAERKQDLEYIMYQIITRFNPLAEWVVDDMHLSGRIQAKITSITYSSDIDAEASKQPFHRADINVEAEGWLPHQAYQIVPTVLGKVGILAEENGETLDTFTNAPANQ